MKCLSSMSFSVLVCTIILKVQDEDVGDWTMSTVILEGELLQEAEWFKVKYINPMTIIEGIVSIDVKPFTFQSFYIISFDKSIAMLMNVGWDIILTFTFTYIKWYRKLCSKGFGVCIYAFVYKAIQDWDVEAPTFCDGCFLGLHVVQSDYLLKEKGLNIPHVLIDELNVVDPPVVMAP